MFHYNSVNTVTFVTWTFRTLVSPDHPVIKLTLTGGKKKKAQDLNTQLRRNFQYLGIFLSCTVVLFKVFYLFVRKTVYTTFPSKQNFSQLSNTKIASITC